MVEPTPTKNNIQKRISDLKAFIKYNESVRQQTEKILKQIDHNSISKEQLDHLIDKVNTCNEIIELHSREIQDLEDYK